MFRSAIGALIPVAFVLTFVAPNESFAQLSRPAFVATEQIVVGGILGSDPTITAGLNGLLADRLLTSPFLLEIADLDDPTYTNDDNITLNVFGGFDLDGDNTNNGSGMNDFVVDPLDYDPATGGAISSFPDGTIVDSHMVAGPGTIIVGGIPLNDLTVEADFTETATTGVYEFQSTETSAFLTQEFLETQPAPAPFTGSLVDLLTAFGILPDIDADMDGTNESYSAVFTFAGISCNLYYSYIPSTQGFVATEQIVVGGILGSDPTIAAGLNSLLADNLVNSPFLLEIAELDDPTYTDDDNITLNAFGGFDMDEDPTNNASGTNEFVIDPTGYDQTTGDPISSFPDGTIVDSHLIAGPGTIFVSGIPLNDLTVEADFFPGTFTGTYTFQSGETEAFLTQSFLETQPAPAPFSGTLVDLLTAFGILPDVDADMDGTNESYSAVFTFAGITCELYHSSPPATGAVEDCSNGVDDDGDGLIDCDDPDCTAICNPGGVEFRRGDVNSDGARNIADAIFMLGFLFTSGPAPACDDAADVNDDGAVNIADAIYLLGFLFTGGPDAPAPGDNCGIDPTDTDTLDCAMPTGGC
ncbi:MAG: dockerin type I repeat-containing protein [Planctomycetota bacterium]|nr:dockerin type I repeat-containing protein [Planctomycetota bacterium]